MMEAFQESLLRATQRRVDDAPPVEKLSHLADQIAAVPIVEHIRMTEVPGGILAGTREQRAPSAG